MSRLRRWVAAQRSAISYRLKVPRLTRALAALPLLGLLGACLTAFAPGIRPVSVHAGMTASTPNDTCMGCHEAERDVLAALQAAPADERARQMRAHMEGQGASLVAQWMLDDPRTCAGCHEPRGGGR